MAPGLLVGSLVFTSEVPRPSSSDWTFTVLDTMGAYNPRVLRCSRWDDNYFDSLRNDATMRLASSKLDGRTAAVTYIVQLFGPDPTGAYIMLQGTRATFSGVKARPIMQQA